MRAVVLLFVVACSGTSSSSSINSAPPTAPPTTPAPSSLPDRSCRTDDDCQWTSITHEIADKLDCSCRECLTTIVNVETARRREEAYARVCDFHKSADGRSCPVLKCQMPVRVSCKSGECSR